MAAEIADGMAYLASKRIIHRYLADIILSYFQLFLNQMLFCLEGNLLSQTIDK